MIIREVSEITRNYFLEHYDHPIYEGGRQLKDRICMKMDIEGRKDGR